MSKQFETGNAKNVANLQKIIQQVTTYTNYNPAVANLTITNLNQLHNNAQAIILSVKQVRNSNKNAIHKRQETYQALKPLATKIINQVEILNLSKGTINQAKSINRLIQGKTKKKKQIHNNQENQQVTPNTISTSRQSYTQLADNFTKLLQLLTTINNYNPNIPELQVPQLTAYLEQLIQNTKDVNQTQAQLNKKLIQRNQLLYTSNTSLYTTAQNIKKYVKSLYGATSPEYVTISKIKFSKH
ncbi:hypothetical protein [Lacinutrix undariae]